MKTFKKVLATTLAAAMVVTAVPVTSAGAAASPKLSAKTKTCYVGKNYTLKVTTPSSWKSVKVTAKSKKSVATTKVSKKTVTIKTVKAGTTTVTVKVTGKNKKGKKLSKSLKCKVTVKNPKITLDKTALTLAVGETGKLNATTAPKSAASSVTYTTSDEKVAIVANDGTVTAIAAGEATITATEKCGTKTVTATAKLTVKKTILKDAKQTKATQIEATVAGDTKDLKAADFKVTNTATNATVAVKSAAAKKDAPNIIVIDTFTDMKDAKDYSVEYDGTKVTFTATDGAVAKVGLTKTEVPAGKLTEVKLTTIDKNGVVLDESTGLDATDSSKGKVTADTTLTKGYKEGSSIYLPSVGDTATVKVTYHTGVFGTDGKEAGNIEETFTVTAIDPALVNLKYAVTIGTSAPAWKAASFKANDKIAIGSTKNAYFRITDDNGDDITNYSDYKVESADKTKLLVNNTALTNNSTAVSVQGVAEGTTYILVTKDDKTVASLPVTIQGKPVATTLDLSKTSVTVAQNGSIDEIVDLTLKDQYGDNMTISSATVKVLGAPKSTSTKSKDTDMSATLLNGNNKLEISGADFSTGTKLSHPDDLGEYTLLITAKDVNNKEKTRSLTVKVVEKGTTASAYDVRVDNATVDTTVNSDADAAKDPVINITVAKMANGSAIDEAANAIYTIRNAKGDIVYSDGDTLNYNDGSSKTMAPTNVKTGAAFTYTAGGLAVKVMEHTTAAGKTKVVKNFEAGRYTIEAKIVSDADGSGKTKIVTVNGSFEIKDTQDSRVSYNMKDNKFGNSTTVAVGFSTKNNVVITYDGIEQTLDPAGTDVTKVVGTALTGGGAFIKTVTVYVNVSGTTSYVPVTITVNDQIATCDPAGVVAE